MDIPDLTAELPAPRDDEPPELRAQIVKELRDHLECAFQRELLLTGNETEAVRRAIARFGDPAKIARKLWFDALREKIMSQRVLIGLCAAMLAACLGMGFFNWKVASDNVEAIRSLIDRSDAANRALVEQSREMNQLILAQSRESNEALLKGMGNLIVTSGVQQSPEWVPFKIRLVLDKADGPPAVGYEILLKDRPSVPGGPASTMNLSEKSNSDGILDCGRLRSGTYYVTVTTPWREFSNEQDVYIRAGVADQVRTIVCPSAPRSESETSITLDLPPDLRDRRLAAVCQFRSEGRMIADTHWTTPGAPEWTVRIVSSRGEVWKCDSIELPAAEVLLANSRTVAALLRRDLRVVSHGRELEGTPFRSMGRPAGVRLSAMILLPDGMPKDATEKYLWIPANYGDVSFTTDLTAERADANNIRVPIPESLANRIREVLKELGDRES